MDNDFLGKTVHFRLVSHAYLEGYATNGEIEIFWNIFHAFRVDITPSVFVAIGKFSLVDDLGPFLDSGGFLWCLCCQR